MTSGHTCGDRRGPSEERPACAACAIERDDAEANDEKRVRAHHHADLRLRFALAIAFVHPPVKHYSGCCDGSCNAAKWVFDLADALAAEDERRRREEGL